MYQGLGQMLTIRLQHHQGCSETPKCAYVIYGQPLTSCLNQLGIDDERLDKHSNCIGANNFLKKLVFNRLRINSISKVSM